MYDSAYRLIVAVHHMLGTDGLKEAAGQAFYGGGYRYAGSVILDGEECCPDRALEIRLGQDSEPGRRCLVRTTALHRAG